MNAVSNWNQRYADWALRHSGKLAALMLVLAALCTAGLHKLQFTTDYRAYFSDDNPELAALEALEQNFSRAETLLVAVEPASGEVFTVETLRAVRALTDRWSQLPYSRGSFSLTSYYEARAEGDDIIAAPLIPEGPISDALPLAEIRARALDEPRLVHGVLPPTADVTGVVFYFELPHQKPAEEISAVADAARALVAQVRAEHPGIQFHLSGLILFNEAMAGAIGDNAKNLYPLAYLVMFGLLALLFRGASAMAGTLLVTLMAVGTAMGAAGWLGITLTAASITAGVIVLTLAIADCVHLLTTYSEQRNSGAEVRQALNYSLRINGQAIFLTSLTTALGFLGMNFSDSPPFRDLGNIVAIGVFAAWIYSVAFLPGWLLRVVPGQSRLSGDFRDALRRFADVVIRHRAAVFAVGAGGILLLASGLPRNQFGDDYVRFFDAEHPFRIASEFTNERLTGMQYVEFGVYAQGPGEIYSEQYLQRLDAFVAWLRAQPEVVKVSSLIDILKRLNQTMNQGDAAYYSLPEQRQLSAQYLLFYEMSLPSGTDLTHLVNLEKSATRVTVQLSTISSGAVRDFDLRARAWQAQHWPAAQQTPGSGISVMFANIALRNFSSMLVGTGIAFALICVLLLMAFRSPRLAAISLVPNLAPAAAGFGAWGYLVGQVGMSLSIVVSLTLGIVVDDTIHLLSRYARARREQQMSAEDALREAFGSVGVALWFTSLVLVAGFAVLSSSSFALTAQLGQLATMVVLLALWADFLVLPPLLLWLDRRRY